MSEIIKESSLERTTHRLHLGAWPLKFVFEGSQSYCREKLARNAASFIGCPWSFCELIYSDESKEPEEKEQTSGVIWRSQSGKIKLTQDEQVVAK